MTRRATGPLKRALALLAAGLLGCRHHARFPPGLEPVSLKPAPSLALPVGPPLHAVRVASGLSGDALRRARFVNMCTAFVDVKALEGYLAKLKKARKVPGAREDMERWRKWLDLSRKVLKENAAFFPRKERAVEVSETYEDAEGGRFIRRLKATLANGETVTDEETFEKRHPPGEGGKAD